MQRVGLHNPTWWQLPQLYGHERSEVDWRKSFAVHLWHERFKVPKNKIYADWISKLDPGDLFAIENYDTMFMQICRYIFLYETFLEEPDDNDEEW